jgi:hypothetical protein
MFIQHYQEREWAMLLSDPIPSLMMLKVTDQHRQLTEEA